MNRLYPSDLPAFVRKYRFPGARVRRVRVVFAGAAGPAVEVVLSVKAAARDLGADPKPVRLRLRLVGADEFRFQKRPSAPAGRVPDARVGYFGDAYFVNLDAFGLGPGEAPKIHDYRASDAYVAGRELYWEELPPKAGRPPAPAG